MSLPPLDPDQTPSKKSKASKISGLKDALAKVRGKLSKFDRRFLIAATIAIAVVLLVVGYVVVGSITSSSNKDPEPTTTQTSTPAESPTTTSKPTETSVPSSEPKNPLMKDGLDLPEVKDSKSAVTLEVKGTTISSSQSGSLSMTLADNTKLQKASTPCKVKDTLSYCLVATSQSGSQSFDYFYSRDIVHSKLLRDAQDVREVDIPNSASAAFATIQFGDQGNRRVLAIASSDSSGYLIVLPEGAGTSTEDTLVSEMKLK